MKREGNRFRAMVIGANQFSATGNTDKEAIQNLTKQLDKAYKSILNLWIYPEETWRDK